MHSKDNLTCRHFISYTGVKLPLQLITPIEGETVEGRITFFRGFYDAEDKLLIIEKVVYGEIEFEHHYNYYPDGRLQRAEMLEPDCEPRVMDF